MLFVPKLKTQQDNTRKDDISLTTYRDAKNKVEYTIWKFSHGKWGRYFSMK